MATPTVDGIAAQGTTLNTWPTVALTAAAGDLCILLVVGNATFQSPGTAPTGGAGSGWTQMGANPISSTSTDRLRAWWKLLAAGDITSGQVAANTFTAGTNGGTGRLLGGIFACANGFDAATCFVEALDSEANLSGGSTVFTPQNKARPQVIFALFENLGTGQPALTLTWDGGSAQAPYIDESNNADTSGTAGNHYGTSTSTIQADFKVYDTGDTPSAIAYSAGIANTTHICFAANFQANSGDASITVNDTIGLTDPKTYLTASSRVISDSLPLTDLESYSTTGGAFTRLINDALVLTDVVPRALTFTFSDTIAVTDAGSANLSSPERFEISDTLSRDLGVTINDHLGLADLLGYAVPGQSILANRFNLTDLNGIAVGYGKTIATNQINLTDALTYALFVAPIPDVRVTIGSPQAKWKATLA